MVMGPIQVAMVAAYLPAMVGGLSLAKRMRGKLWWAEALWIPLIPLGWLLARGAIGWFIGLFLVTVIWWTAVGRMKVSSVRSKL